MALLLSVTSGFAQGQLSGDLMANVSFFQRDASINATNTPLYDNVLSGGESWLALRYAYKGFTGYLRMDAFHNSNLFNPSSTLTAYGIGAYSISKDINNLSITGGYIYDQIGSGILFRSYEDRGLLIDNALVGLELKYKLGDNMRLKAFTGQQKQITPDVTFNRYKPVIKGINLEGDLDIGKAHLSPGIGALNRTLDQNNIDILQSTINNQQVDTRFVPLYNMYAFTAYNTLTVGGLSWYVEGAYKTHDNILKDDRLQREDGNVVFSTLGYARKGIALNVTAKRTENFEMRTSPNELLLRGIINWQPIVARLRPQRLMARYTPASQNLSEKAYNVDLLVNPNDNLDLTFTYAHINTLKEVKLYREMYGEFEWRGWENWIVDGGLQVLEYNQELYQTKPGVPLVKAITPFIEVTRRLDPKHSLRMQAEYMSTKQDFGSWIYGLLEYSIAPTWSFAVSDMYLLEPAATSIIPESKHFFQVFTAYTKGPNRFTAAYVKQVEGINCTGGVCRYEPAFSGVRFGITSTF